MAERKRRQSRAEIAAAITLEEALKVVAQNGMQVVARSPEQELQLQESSLEALGVREPAPKPRLTQRERVLERRHLVELTLAFSHTIGAQTYGPGVCTLPVAQADLAALLREHDEAAVRHQNDTLLARPSRSYMIVEVETGMGRRSVAMQVPDDFFVSPLGMDDPRYIHTHIHPGNADYFAGINNMVISGQGKMF